MKEPFNITTKTVIIHPNINIHLDHLFNHLTTVSLEVPRTLKRKKDIENYILLKNFPNGTILTITYKDKVKGFRVKKRKQWTVEQDNRKYFRNGLTIVAIIDNKLLNFKVPKKGKFQFTGCKDEKQAATCMKLIWNMIKDHPHIYTMDGDSFYFYMETVMTNIVFKLGFEINREKLDKFINTETPFHSLLETSFGYTGVNIKKPYQMNMNRPIQYYKEEDKWMEQTIDYQTYFDIMLSEDEKQKEMNKIKNISFLVFYSGSVIMSGLTLESMMNDYHQFYSTLQNARSKIEEVIC